MKLIRFGEEGKERPGILDKQGRRWDCSGFGEDWNEAFFREDGLERLSSWLKIHQNSLPEISEDLRLGPPVARPSKIICVGLNYSKHAQEAGMAVPEVPILFMKASSALCGPNDPIYLPKNSKQTDWEVELAIIIGKKATYVDLDHANDHIAGYALHNDYSEREFQIERGGQWVKGKSCDTFAPLGPLMVTKDEVGDPNNLKMWLKVNGEMKQNSATSDLIFKVQYLVHYISQFMTLLPGDVISTGTPEGVGLGQKPVPVYLKAGDVIELGIEGLGEQKQLAVKNW